MELTQENLDKLVADNKKLTESVADMGTLKASVEALEAKNREILNEKASAKKAAEEAASEAARKSGDVEALENSWKEKLASEISARDQSIAEYKGMVSRMTVGAEANKLASELALPGSADALLPHIERRLTVEVKDGAPIVRVLDADGKPSALSVADLRNEISETKSFAPILVGSGASGGGNVGGKGGQGGKVINRDAFDVMPQPDRAAFFKAGGRIAA